MLVRFSHLDPQSGPVLGTWDLGQEFASRILFGNGIPGNERVKYKKVHGNGVRSPSDLHRRVISSSLKAHKFVAGALYH